MSLPYKISGELTHCGPTFKSKQLKERGSCVFFWYTAPFRCAIFTEARFTESMRSFGG